MVDKIANAVAAIVKVFIITLIGIVQMVLLLSVVAGMLYGFVFACKFLVAYFSIDKDTFFMYVFFYPSLIVTLIFCYAMGSETIEGDK